MTCDDFNHDKHYFGFIGCVRKFVSRITINYGDLCRVLQRYISENETCEELTNFLSVGR